MNSNLIFLSFSVPVENDIIMLFHLLVLRKTSFSKRATSTRAVSTVATQLNSTQLNSTVESGQNQLVCVIALQFDLFLLHSNLIPDSSVGLNPSHDSQLTWVGWCVLPIMPTNVTQEYINQ